MHILNKVGKIPDISYDLNETHSCVQAVNDTFIRLANSNIFSPNLYIMSFYVGRDVDDYRAILTISPKFMDGFWITLSIDYGVVILDYNVRRGTALFELLQQRLDKSLRTSTDYATYSCIIAKNPSTAAKGGYLEVSNVKLSNIISYLDKASDLLFPNISMRDYYDTKVVLDFYVDILSKNTKTYKVGVRTIDCYID